MKAMRQKGVTKATRAKAKSATPHVMTAHAAFYLAISCLVLIRLVIRVIAFGTIFATIWSIPFICKLSQWANIAIFVTVFVVCIFSMFVLARITVNVNKYNEINKKSVVGI